MCVLAGCWRSRGECLWTSDMEEWCETILTICCFMLISLRFKGTVNAQQIRVKPYSICMTPLKLVWSVA